MSYEKISGYWHYGIDKNPEYCVKIIQNKDMINIEYFIWDKVSNSKYVYAVGRGRFLSFWEVMIEGKYIKNHKKTFKGQSFIARWYLFDNSNKIQEISYWGVHRIKNYLVRR